MVCDCIHEIHEYKNSMWKSINLFTVHSMMWRSCNIQSSSEEQTESMVTIKKVADLGKIRGCLN